MSFTLLEFKRGIYLSKEPWVLEYSDHQYSPVDDLGIYREILTQKQARLTLGSITIPLVVFDEVRGHYAVIYQDNLRATLVKAKTLMEKPTTDDWVPVALGQIV